MNREAHVPHVRLRKQLVVRMSELLRRMRMTATSLGAEFDINREHIKQFQNDTWQEIARDELQILMTLSQENGLDFLELRPHPVWETFEEKPAVFFIGEAEDHTLLQADVGVQNMLQQ